jgi:nicotinamidase/pyrazinamidase
MKTALFVIDMQNDFCNPDGALFVQGAEKDVSRLSNFLKKHIHTIDHICLTLDTHHVVDISHACFWSDSLGNHPAVFTSITYAEALKGNWIPCSRRDEVIEYLRLLEENGEYIHTIWPEHCVWGSSGASIADDLMNVVKEWSRLGQYFDIIVKGTNPFTEHFGAFRANIPLEDSPETQLNLPLIQKLAKFDKILIAGEAKSHCVANTIKQLFDFPEITDKITILTDCMSDVSGFEHIADQIYRTASDMGAQFTKSTDF